MGDEVRDCRFCHETKMGSGSVSESVSLLNCPFCGGEAKVGTIEYQSGSDITKLNGGQTLYYFVNCISCGTKNAGLVGWRTEEEAVKHWNTRKPSDDEGLREKLEKIQEIARRPCDGMTDGGINAMGGRLREIEVHCEAALRMKGGTRVERGVTRYDSGNGATFSNSRNGGSHNSHGGNSDVTTPKHADASVEGDRGEETMPCVNELCALFDTTTMDCKHGAAIREECECRKDESVKDTSQHTDASVERLRRALKGLMDITECFCDELDGATCEFCVAKIALQEGKE